MNWEAMGATAEVFGAVGLVVTLIYLSRQVKDNTASIRRARSAGFIAQAPSWDGVKATAAGAGIALLPCLVADHDRHLVRVPQDGAPEPRQIWQAVHKDLRDSARIRAVLDFIGKTMRPVQERSSAA